LDTPSTRAIAAIGKQAWFALMNRKSRTAACRSPEQTRPRLLIEYRAPAVAACSHAAAGSTHHARMRSDQKPPPPGGPRFAQPGRPTREWSGRLAQTRGQDRQDYVQHGRGRPSVGETPANTVDVFLASAAPPARDSGCPPNRVNPIPMRQGFLYLVAIIDWATRRVLSWRLSNTLTAGFCVEALSEALARFGKPGIFNTDQGAQFTSDEFTKMLTDQGIAISMDGRGRCHDNIFVERLWWTVKHEWVYLRPAANGIEQKRSLAEFFDWYNLRRPHQALGWRTPDEAYLGQSTAASALAA